jgi:hypothetical protein
VKNQFATCGVATIVHAVSVINARGKMAAAAPVTTVAMEIPPAITNPGGRLIDRVAEPPIAEITKLPDA